MLAIVEGGSAGWIGGKEGIEKRPSLGIVGWEERALAVSLVLVTGGEEYLSLRAALGTSNSESNTNSKVSTSMKSPCSRECLVVDVDRL